jgi:pimeloyl-ACP methyl ester carboxylesterase
MNESCPHLASPSDPERDLEIETPKDIPLADALARWRNEAQPGCVDTGRYSCRYFVWGDGPPLVFIHGLCERARSFVPMMAALRHFRCIGYELPEGGPDGARLTRYQHADLVSDLFALLDALRIPQAYVFGSSFGSTIGLAAMRAQPERIPRAILQGGFAWRPVTGWLRLVCLQLRFGRGPMGTLPFRRVLHPDAERAVFRKLAKPEMWNFLVENSDGVARAAAARRGLMLDRLDLRPQLPQIRQPILLISGDGDSLVPKSCDESLLSGLPNAARAEIPMCGHYPQYSHPALTAELTRQFLTAPSCVSHREPPTSVGGDSPR